MKPPAPPPVKPPRTHAATGRSTGLAGRPDDQFYDTLTQANNELINLQRDLVRANAHLIIARDRAAVAEQARAQLEAELRESHKMQAIGTLAGGIAHEFNNIVGAIFGSVELARGELPAGHPAQADLVRIHKASLRARGLVEQIQAFGRLQAQPLVHQSAAPLVEAAMALLRNTLPALVRLDPSLGTEPLHMRADASQIEQVLLNLCTNAWHAFKGGSGRIQVVLDAVELAPGRAAPAPGMRPGPWVHLAVIDDGCGMDAPLIERIFEPFFTTKPVGQGTGLGLSVVHGIVAGHGGAITVHSTPGQGSRFDLYFPRLDPSSQPMPLDEAPACAPAPGRGQHVLYLDDDETLLAVFGPLLQTRGYRVSCFADAQAALQALREQPGAFDVLVSDYNMPGLSGLEVAREARRLLPAMPVLLVTGHVAEGLRESAAAAGVRQVLLKERAFEDLAPAIGRELAAVKT